MSELKGKQAQFVLEYLKDRNGAQAAIRAGYSEKTAKEMACENLTKPHIKAAIDAATEKVAEETKTDIHWVRKRLMEEATDYTEFASHAARIKAIEVIARLNGDFEKDNKQKVEPLADLLKTLGGSVLGPGRTVLPLPPEDDE